MTNGKHSASASPQPFESKSEGIRLRYIEGKRADPMRFARKIDLSWSVWMFGLEPIEVSLERLARNGLGYVELKADRWTTDSGIPKRELGEALSNAGMKVSGACGMFSTENDLSSPSAYSRQNAIDYIRRELELLVDFSTSYLIVVPTAVGRSSPSDHYEMERSAASLRVCGDDFAQAGIKAAVEPIRAAEVSLVHSVSDAIRYIEIVDHPAIGHINGDVYHMSLEESHVGEAILTAGSRLANLHLADSNRDALGTGTLDIDTVIMAAYLTGMNLEGRFLTPEPLGPFPDPYVLANGPCDTQIMDALVSQSLDYFREREEFIRALD